MGEDDSTEIEQPKKKKRGRPLKQSPGVEASQYFKTKSSPIVAEVASDLDHPKIATDCWRNKSYKEKRRHYRLTCKLKGFVTHCTAIPVESWEAFRVDHRNNCGLCGLIIEEVDTLRKHIQEHIFLKCLLCSSSFNLLDSFTSHMQNHTSTMSVLPCSSAVINDKIGGESYLDRNRESDNTLTSVQSEKEVVQESVVDQNEIGDHGSTAVLVCDAPCALNFDETFPETNLLEVEVMTGQQSSSFDGLQVAEAPSHPHTEKSVNNTGPTGSHCGIPPISHSVPASVNPLVCTVCNFQSKSAGTLGEHNLQYHNLNSCFCQGSFSKDNVDKNGSCGTEKFITMEKFSPNSEMSDPRVEISGVVDHASYCRPVKEVQNNVEIIDIDSGPSLPVISDQWSVNENIETIICDDSSDSCVVFFGNPSQKCMPNPMKPLTCHFKPAVDEVGMQRNKISSVNCTRANNEPVKTPISFATLNLKVDDPLNLLDDNVDSGRFFETVVIDDFVGDVVEVLDDCSKSKTLEVSRKTKESGEKYKADETVSELVLDEPSAKKRKSDDGFSSRETESSPQKPRSRNSAGRVSSKELKSLFYDSPESFEGVCNTPVTRRVTRHSVSSSEKSDPPKKTPDSTSNQSVGNSKKSEKSNSSKVSCSTRLYKEKGCNIPKAAKNNIELLNSEPNRRNEKISKVPSTVISGEDFKSSSILKSTSRTAGSRANGRKWKKLLKATEASSSENCYHHRPARAANDKDLSKTPPANESDSDILAEVTSFEVIDVRNINDTTPGSYENEADVSTTCQDPLALSFEEALDVDSFCGGDETPYIRHLSSNAVQFSNSEVLFDLKKFSTKILTTKEIQMKDVPKLVDGQWIVYNCIFRWYNTNVNKVLAFSNKSFYLNLFNSEPRSELILWDKIVEDHTYFCDYRHGNHTTIPVKFIPLELKSNGSYIKLDEATTETVAYKKNCPKLTSPSAESAMMNDSLSIKHGKGIKKFENEGNGEWMDSEGDSTQNQEKGVSVQLGHETTYPLLGKNAGLLDDCEDDTCSVELENGTSNERWMELMNLEMEANEKLGDIEINAIETKCDASLVKPDPVIQNGNRNSNLEENAALDDEVDGEKSPVLINGTMQIMSSGRSDFKIDIVPVFNKNSSNSDAVVAGSPTNIEKPSYWGFSDPETDEEKASESLMIKTIDAVKAVSVIPGTEYPDKTTGKKKPVTRKFDWSGLDKMLKEIDEIPILGESLGKSVKSFSKKSASLPVGHSLLEDNIDTTTDINTEHSTEGNIENKSHLVRKLDAPLLDHQTICKNIVKKEVTICPTVLNENGEKRSVIQNPGLQLSSRNTFNLSTGISCDQFRKCSSLMKETQEKRSDIQNPGPQSSCSSVNNTFDLSAGMSSDQFKKDLRQMKNVCHSQMEMNLYKNYHQPICKAESMDSGSYCPNDEYGKRSVECAEFLRVNDEKCPHDVDRGSRFCDQQTIDLERLYENLQESLDGANEGNYGSSDESIYNSYCHSRSSSCSSSSFSPDYVDDIVLQASHPRGVSQPHSPDPREMQEYMSPPMRCRPLSNLTSMSREGFGSPRSTPFSPTPPRSLRTPCHFQGRYRSTSSSPASDRSTGSSAISLSPTFSDDYDFH